MRRARALAASLALLSGCGDGGRPTDPPPAPPPAPPPVATTDWTPSADAPTSVNVTQAMFVYRLPRKGTGTPRSRDAAFALASDVLRRAKAGENFGRLILDHSDDRDEFGRVFNDGSYTIYRDRKEVDARLKKAAFETPVGSMAREVVDTGYAFVVLRRDS